MKKTNIKKGNVSNNRNRENLINRQIREKVCTWYRSISKCIYYNRDNMHPGVNADKLWNIGRNFWNLSEFRVVYIHYIKARSRTRNSRKLFLRFPWFTRFKIATFEEFKNSYLLLLLKLLFSKYRVYAFFLNSAQK